jgi:hypothetical protein
MLKYCKSWVGLDTSDDMIRRCKRRVRNADAKAYKVDALEDPERAMQLVLDGLEGLHVKSLLTSEETDRAMGFCA